MEEAVTVEREMGCTREDLLRWLPGAAAHAGAEREADGLTLRLGPGRVRLEPEERPPRRIAAVSLPVLRVRFHFEGLEAAARTRFLERFDAYTRRGGG